MATNLYLKAKLEERASQAAVLENIQNLAAQQQRDLTDEERNSFDSLVKRISFLDEEIERISKAEANSAKFMDVIGARNEAAQRASMAEQREAARRDAIVHEREAQREREYLENQASWGERFIRSDEFKSYRGHGSTPGFAITGQFLKQGGGGVEERAVLKTDSFSDMALPQPQMWDGPTIPTLRTPLFDAIGVVPTQASSVEYIYFHLNDPSAMAGEVPEGQLKPEAPLDGELVSVSMATYAWWKAVTRQALEDLSLIRGVIDRQLRRGIIRKINDETAKALTANADIQDAAGGSDLIGQMRAGIAQVEENGFTANAVVLNPMDWAALDTGLFPAIQRNTGPSYGGPQINNGFWGLRPIPVPGVPAGTAYVGDFVEGMTFFDREQTQVFITDSHTDFFVRNQLVILAEARGKVVVTNAAALIKCAGEGAESGGNGGGPSPAGGQASPAPSPAKAPATTAK